MNRYFECWNDYEDMCNEFFYNNKPKEGKGFPTDEEILFASYEAESYEGSAVIVFKRDGKLYEYEGSHCSCNCLSEDNETFGSLMPVTVEYLKTVPVPYGARSNKDAWRDMVEAL